MSASHERVRGGGAGLEVVRVFDGDDDRTHLETGLLRFGKQLGPQVFASEATPSEATMFAEIGAGEAGSQELHPAPRRQLAIVVEGSFEIVSETGERAACSPGSVLLLEDLGRGKGHRNIASEATRVLFVAVPDSWNVLDDRQ